MRATPAAPDHLLTTYQPAGPVHGRLLGAASTTPGTDPPTGAIRATGARRDAPTVRSIPFSPAAIGVPTSEGPEPRNLDYGIGDGDEPEHVNSPRADRRTSGDNANAVRADAPVHPQTARHLQGASSSLLVPMATTGTTALSSAQGTQRDDQGPHPQATVPRTSNAPLNADQRHERDADLIARLRGQVAAQAEILARQQASLDKRTDLARQAMVAAQQCFAEAQRHRADAEGATPAELLTEADATLNALPPPGKASAMLRSLASLSKKRIALELKLDRATHELADVCEQLTQTQEESTHHVEATAEAVLEYNAEAFHRFLLQEATAGHASATGALAGHLSTYQHNGTGTDGQPLCVEAHHLSTMLHDDPTFAYELAGTALPLAAAPKRTTRIGLAVTGVLPPLDAPAIDESAAADSLAPVQATGPGDDPVPTIGASSSLDESAAAAALAPISATGPGDDPVHTAATGRGAAPAPRPHGHRPDAQGKRKRGRPTAPPPADRVDDTSDTGSGDESEPLQERYGRERGVIYRPAAAWPPRGRTSDQSPVR